MQLVGRVIVWTVVVLELVAPTPALESARPVGDHRPVTGPRPDGGLGAGPGRARDGAGGGHGSASGTSRPTAARQPINLIRALGDDSNANCQDVCHQNDSAKCLFVQSTADCSVGDGQIDYTHFAYCTFSAKYIPLAIFILVSWWLFLFVGLAVAADDFFCPSLVVIAKTLRMSDNIAGVTLLAFGNGSPDVFSAIAAIGSMKNGDAGLAIGALVGAGIFVTTVVAGSVAVVQPFHAMERPFLRDIVFYLAAVFMTFYVLYSGMVTLLQAAAFIGLYLVYVAVVIVGRYIYRCQQRREEEDLRAATPSVNNDADATAPDADMRRHVSAARSISNKAIKSMTSGLAEVSENIGVGSMFGGEVVSNPTLQPQHSSDNIASMSSADEMTPLLQNLSGSGEHQVSPLREFLLAVNPIDIEGWPQMRWYTKVYEVIKAPSQSILQLSIPIVDYSEDKHRWNRHLRSLQCVVSPLVAIFLANHQAPLYKLGGVFPTWALVVLLGLLIGGAVFVTSANDRPPCYHWVFAYVGFIVAVIFIAAIANEIVNLLQTFGIVFNISNAILGLTLLAWGNSLGDLVADTTMARQGFPRTGISACFGGPLFNLLLGIGIPFTIKTIKEGVVQVNFMQVQILLLSTLAVSLLSSLVIAPIIKFKLNRFYGYYLYVLYAIFFVLAILMESEII